MRRFDPQKLDWAVAALLTVAAELEVWLGGGRATHHHPLAIALVSPLIAVCVAVRRLFPATAGLGAGLLATVVAALWGAPAIIGYGIAWICAMYGLAVWARRRRFAFAVATIAAAAPAAALGPVSLPNALQFGVVTVFALLLVHRVVGDRERRARVAERERDVAAREAIVEERARIARELHDVIAHHVSMIVLQAGAERRVLDSENASTREVLETVEQSGRSALTEMRRLLGMLRGEENEPLTPQPGLADVQTLVEQLREAGLPVELQVEGERRELPVGIELSAYRIVQEALTNAPKHTRDAQASVHVRYGQDSLELEIVDDGTGEVEPVASGGHGLAGMRERVALYGGRLDAGRRPSGGFAVRVLLPTR